jgi:hypothetical protein
MNYNVRETVRRQLKLAHYEGHCSEVIPNFMYLGGYIVAENRELLAQNKITHVLNCAGDYCQNRFVGDLEYKTYYLKDSKPEVRPSLTQSIEAVFYDCIEYIEKVRKEGGRIYVHCVQGVSRSSSVCLAYLIFKERLTYDDAFKMIRQKRGIVSPNLGFMVQLMMFYQRLFEDYSKLTVHPKIFAVSRHQVEDPNTIVARLIFDEKLYTGKNTILLDPRGVFIITNDTKSYIWIGSECDSSYRQSFLEYAIAYSDKLVRYERMPQDPQLVEQSNEPLEFWAMFGLDREPNPKYSYNKFWDNW